MSITSEEILHQIVQQGLSEKCSFTALDEANFFQRYTTATGILQRTEYLDATQDVRRFPVYTITYDEVVDEFHFNAYYFDKENDSITNVRSEYKILKWINAFGNQYVLTFPNGLSIGNVFKTKLPIITKTT